MSIVSTFDDNERSTSQNRPIDLYTFATPTFTYRHTSSPVNVVFGGNTFTPLTISRGNQQITQDPTGRELIVYLPITHPLVQRWATSGIPEHGVLVTIQRYQPSSNTAMQYRNGYAGGIMVTGHVAQIRLPEITDDATRIQLPVIAAQLTCNHILYDAGCAPNPGTDGPAASAFLVTTTIAAGATGTAISVAGVGGNADGWFQFGDAVHVATQQRRMILSQIAAALTLIAPFVGAANGDVIQIYAGCDHGMLTCVSKFGNRVNFGGHPQMSNTQDLWGPGGFGVVQQF